MTTKRDQLQAHQFLLQRMVHALVLRETDPAQPPFRRGVQAGWGGLAIAVLSLGVVWIFALVHPGGNTAWMDGKSVIVMKDGGSRMVLHDGVLYPVANLTSAMLILGDHAPTMSVTASSLGDTPRGPMLGIAGAPDSLPDTKHLLAGAWSLCSQPGTDDTGARTNSTVLMVGQDPAGGEAMSDRAVLVRGAGRSYLVWHGYRHPIADTATATAALLLDSESWAPVGPSWLDVLPVGASVGPVRLTGIGHTSRAVPHARVGQLFVVRSTSGRAQYYLAEAARLRPISALQYDLQRSWPSTRAAYPRSTPRAVSLDPAVAARSTVTSAAGEGPYGLPSARPTFARMDPASAAVCATFAGGGGVPQLTVAPRMPLASPAAATPRTSSMGVPLADEVIVAPGHGALVRAMASPGAPSGPVYFVSDLGRRFAVPDTQVQSTLGLVGATPVPVPAGLLMRVPAGPPLDPDTALRPV